LVADLLKSDLDEVPVHLLALPELARWLDGPRAPTAVIEAARTLLHSRREEGLASLYARLVSAKSRRTLGTFFTAPPEMNWMVERWADLHGAPSTVVDVGAGVGIFTAAAARRWPDARVWAVDVNPITLGLLALRVQLDFPIQASDSSTPGVRLVLEDFTRWMLSGWGGLGARRLILGNPPYTRLQLLAQDQRTRLLEVAGGLCGSRSSLSAIITAQSLLALGEDDGLCLLLPAQWLESDYAAGLREKLWRSRHRRVEMRLFDQDPFEDATVDAVALIVGPREAAPQPIVFTVSGGNDERVLTDRMSTPREFRSLFRAATRSDQSHPDTTVLAKALTVRRGLATGANAFFTVTAEEADERGLPKSALRPLIRRLFNLPDKVDSAVLEEIPPTRRWLLLSASEEMVASDPVLRRYIKEAEVEHGLDRRHLCAQRSVWYDLRREIQTPELIIGQSTQDTFRIVENPARAAILNNLYGLTWNERVPTERRVELLGWLRSDNGQAAIRSASRQQASGLHKIEPRALSQLAIPRKFSDFPG